MEVNSKGSKYQVGITSFQSLPSLPAEYEKDRTKAYKILLKVFQEQHAQKELVLPSNKVRKYQKLNEKSTKKCGQKVIEAHLEEKAKQRFEETFLAKMHVKKIFGCESSQDINHVKSDKYTKEEIRDIIETHIKKRESSPSKVEKLVKRFLRWDASVLKEIEKSCPKTEKAEIKDLREYVGKLQEDASDFHNQAKFLRKVSGAKVRFYEVEKEKKPGIFNKVRFYKEKNLRDSNYVDLASADCKALSRRIQDLSISKSSNSERM